VVMLGQFPLIVSPTAAESAVFLMRIRMCFLYPHIHVPPIPKHRGTLHLIPPHSRQAHRHDFTSLLLPFKDSTKPTHARWSWPRACGVSLVKSCRFSLQTTVGGVTIQR
jgi:hypothetical protein